MTTPKVLTVLLNWRTPDMTLKALDSARVAMAQVTGEIVVVDNDSGDGSFEKMTNATGDMADVRILQSGRNGGFGAGNNVGILAGMSDGTRPDLIYVLNSDAFPAPDAIRLLVDYLQKHPDVGFAGSYIHAPEGDAHLSTFHFPSALSELEGSMRFGPVSRLLKNRAVPVPVPEGDTAIDWLAGASMMMRDSVLQDIGLFDETFFLYFEETDLCLRAANAGHPTHYVRASEVVHIGSVSTGMSQWQKVPTYWFASRHYYFTKNHGKLGLLAATTMHLIGGLGHRLRAVLSRKKPVDPPGFLRQLLAYDAKHLFKPLPSPQIAHPPRSTS